MNENLIESIKQRALADKVPIMEDESLNYVVNYLKENKITSLKLEQQLVTAVSVLPTVIQN